jgi:hypothetical protein
MHKTDKHDDDVMWAVDGDGDIQVNIADSISICFYLSPKDIKAMAVELGLFFPEKP